MKMKNVTPSFPRASNEDSLYLICYQHFYRSIVSDCCSLNEYSFRPNKRRYLNRGPLMDEYSQHKMNIVKIERINKFCNLLICCRKK